MDIEPGRVEPVMPIGRRRLKLLELALLDGDDCRLELEFLSGHLDNPGCRNGRLEARPIAVRRPTPLAQAQDSIRGSRTGGAPQPWSQLRARLDGLTARV